MAITVGDAVFNFLGDTTQLDQAWQKAETDASAKAPAIQQQVSGIGQAWEKAGAQAEAGATQASQATQQVASAYARLAQATVENQQAQQAVRAILAEIKETGDQSTATIQRLAEAQAAATVAARNLAEAKASLRTETEAATAAEAAATAAAEQMATAAQGAGAAASEAAQVASPEWLALAKATDSATRATIEHSAAQKELEAAIAKAAQSQEGDQAALSALAAAEEKVAIAAANLAAAQKETEIASQAATASMRAEAEAAAQSSIALKEAATAALTFGQDSKLAGEQAAFSMQEAKGSIALAGEEIGVTIPRHIRGFIAELPGVGAALEAAFSGIALLVLAQIIVEATEKLTEFVSETFIYTDAEKEAYAATIELNKTLVDQAAKLKDLQEQYRLIGLEGPAKTKEEFMILTEEVNKNEAALRAAKNTLATFREEQRNGADLGAIHTVTEEQANAAGAAILALTALLKTQYQQQAAFEKQYDQESLQEQIQHGEASINAQKTVSEARIELARAESTLRLTLAKAGYSSLIAAQQDFDNQMYQAQLKALQDSLANEAKDPTRNQDRIKELNAQIEALEDQHQAKMLEIRTKGVQALQAALKAALSQTVSTPVTDIIPLPSEVNQRLQEITDILNQFGVKSAQTWQTEIDKAREAYDKLVELKAPYVDLLQIREKIAEGKVGLAVEQKDIASAAEYRQELENIRKELVALGVTTDSTSAKQERWNRSHDTTIHLLDQWALSMRKNQAELSKTQQAFDSIIMDTSAAFGSAIQAWVLGQESLGKALREALAQEAASIAARAAMWGLYWTAWGIADSFWNPARAGADFASAAEFFAVAALAGAFAAVVNPGRGDSGGATQAPQTEAAAGIQQGPVEQAPAQTQNVPRFATGAVVTGPTLAIFGEAMNSANNAIAQTLAGPGQMEAAIPLEDDRATNAIAQAITKHMPPIRVTTNVHGKSIRHLIKEINHEVTQNDARLTSSNSFKVTRKA